MTRIFGGDDLCSVRIGLAVAASCLRWAGVPTRISTEPGGFFSTGRGVTRDWRCGFSQQLSRHG